MDRNIISITSCKKIEWLPERNSISISSLHCLLCHFCFIVVPQLKVCFSYHVHYNNWDVWKMRKWYISQAQHLTISATYYKRLIVTTPRTADMCTEVSRNSFSILLIHKFKKMYIVVTFLYLYIINIDAFMNTHTQSRL